MLDEARIPPSSSFTVLGAPVPVIDAFTPSVVEEALPPVETKLSSVAFSHVKPWAWRGPAANAATSTARLADLMGDVGDKVRGSRGKLPNIPCAPTCSRFGREASWT